MSTTPSKSLLRAMLKDTSSYCHAEHSGNYKRMQGDLERIELKLERAGINVGVYDAIQQGRAYLRRTSAAAIMQGI